MQIWHSLLTKPFIFLICFSGLGFLTAQNFMDTGVVPLALTQIEDNVRTDIKELCSYGVRSITNLKALNLAALYIEKRLSDCGYIVERQSWMEGEVEVSNLLVRYRGNYHASQYLLLGGHYDSYGGPGADDNATGISSLLILAQMAVISHPLANFMFVFFVNEEPPFFLTPRMGSSHFVAGYSEELKSAAAVLILDMIGFYSNDLGTQSGQQALALGNRLSADFLYAVGHPDSELFLNSFVKEFSLYSELDLLWTDGIKTADLKWSDDISFLETGIPTVLLVDTGGYRYPHYHTPRDTPEKVGYQEVSHIIYSLYLTLR